MDVIQIKTEEFNENVFIVLKSYPLHPLTEKEAKIGKNLEKIIHIILRDFIGKMDSKSFNVTYERDHGYGAKKNRD